MAELRYSYPAVWHVLNRGKPYEPFPWQIQHLHAQVDAGCTRIVLPCGRRSGKSTGLIAEVAREVTTPPVTIWGIQHSPIVYIGGSTSETAMRVWDPVWRAFVPSESGDYIPPLGFLYAGHDKNRGLIEIRGGAKIMRKTADDPRSWQGERVTLVGADESQDYNEDVWEAVMPSLLESGGRLIAIGIPKGKGRFRSYYERGQGADANFYSASVPTSANPIIAAQAKAQGMTVEAFIRSEAEGDLTDDEYARQYLAQWREEEGAVFAGFARYFTGAGEAYRGPHIMSLDLGKMHDYTVAYVGDVARQEFIARLRFNRIDYLDQVPQIAALYHRYGCRFVHMDTNGAGEAPAELLRREYGCHVIPFPWSNASKQALISVMVREVQRGKITFLADDLMLQKEMGLFEGVVSPGGVLRYEAPKGFFDDCVIAAALLIQKMARNKTMAKNPIYAPYVTFGEPTKKRRLFAREGGTV